VSGTPSENFTPVRTVKVHVLPSGDVTHFVASAGAGDMSVIV
jgi:hypothetical protein